jgi:phosphatidylglycerophosphate synthase
MSHDDLRVSALSTLIIAWVVAGGTALVVRAVFDLGGAYPLKASAAFAVVVLAAIRLVGRAHPFSRFGVANQMTTARAACVALLAALIGERASPSLAVTVAAAGAATVLLDGVDGWIARRTKLASAFGARFDVETDAALIQVLAILVWQFGKAGPWIIAAGLLRYGFVGAGWVWPWMRGPLPSSRRARAICVIQIAALIVAILPFVPVPLSSGVAAAGLSALLYSFAVDTLWLWRHAASTLRRAAP